MNTDNRHCQLYRVQVTATDGQFYILKTRTQSIKDIHDWLKGLMFEHGGNVLIPCEGDVDIFAKAIVSVKLLMEYECNNTDSK